VPRLDSNRREGSLGLVPNQTGPAFPRTPSGPSKPGWLSRLIGQKPKFPAWLAKLVSAGRKPEPEPAAQIPALTPSEPMESAVDAGEEYPFLPDFDVETQPQLEPFTDEDKRLLLSDEWFAVASSNVEQIRYDYDEASLFVEFKSGAVYEYYSVPPDVYLAFSRAASPGRFVWNYLRDVYAYKRVQEATRKTSHYPREATVIRTRRDLEPAAARAEYPIPGVKTLPARPRLR
jgi:hypothetical protein